MNPPFSASPIHFTVKACEPSQFETVKDLIKEMDLDDRCLSPDQFMVVSDHENLLGFGRMRKYEHFGELCSLGVTPHHRQNGIGSAIIQAFAQASDLPLYLVCIIPSFFEALGFEECTDYPAEIQEKLDYCMGSLPVEEKYVVMRKLP